MSLQLVRIVLLLPLLSIASTENDQKRSPPPFSVIQTPPFVNVMEGSDVTLSCRVEGNVASRSWHIIWMKMGQKERIKNSTQISVIVNEMNKSSILILKAAKVADSGTYECQTGDADNDQNAKIEVTISERPNVVVSQTPEHVNETEGANVTIRCHFGTVANLSQTEVKWHKDSQELSSPNGSRQLNPEETLRLTNAKVEDSGNYVCTVRIGNRIGSGNATRVHIRVANLLVIQLPSFIQSTEGENLTIDCRVQGKEAKHLPDVTWYKTASDGEKSLMTNATTFLKGRASLFLRNIKKEDSGNYTCEVDKYGQGNGTRVTVLAGREKPSQKANVNADGRQPGQPPESIGSGVGIPVGIGVAVGTLVFLLLLGVVVWRSKRKGKETSGTPSEVNPALSREARKHTSLTNQVSDMTYADLRFHKREVQPDAEVVYAEVKVGAKRPGHKDRATQLAGLH
ncbi:hemicentin-1-like isoform X1 [Python bivittatus]|uniref:Hemicentin-1-like isoform X1 n=1 Tax=Python bivittatus TaxID=176946 RepID=A0A9F5JCT5_PYTBI|nr:hemicentin-1-like isoform X1 [Python bivittatus]